MINLFICFIICMVVCLGCALYENATLDKRMERMNKGLAEMKESLQIIRFKTKDGN